MAISFKPAILALVLGRYADAMAMTKLVGYTPLNDVYEHSRVDLDQQLMQTLLESGDFTTAEKVYRQGTFAMSVARIALESGLPVEVASGVNISGVDSNGNPITLVTYKPAGANSSSIEGQYHALECFLGGNPDPVTTQCLVPSGTVTVAGSDIPYTYTAANDTYNGYTLAGFSTAADIKMRPEAGEPYYSDFQKFFDYYGSPTYSDDWVTAAFNKAATDYPSGKGNADFSSYDDEGRAEAILKATKYMGVWMYAIRELNDALVDCVHSTLGTNYTNDDIVTALFELDEHVAFYTGSLEGTDGAGTGVLIYDLADKRGFDFKTAGPNGDSTNGTSKVNLDLLQEWNSMQKNLQSQSCDAAKANKEKIVSLMTVPLIQGTLRYAYLTGVDKEAANSDEAEGAIFAASVLPLIANCSSSDADTIYNNMKTGQATSASFSAVKTAFENNYACLGIEGSQVGGFWDSETGSYYAGAEPMGYTGSTTGTGGESTGGGGSDTGSTDTKSAAPSMTFLLSTLTAMSSLAAGWITMVGF